MRAAPAARIFFQHLVQLKRRQNYSPRTAATSPSNNGCGRVGRDLYSGCACVATKYGWTSFGYSTNSTSCPPGDVPENTSPEPEVICSRYALLTSYRCRCRSDTSTAPYTSATIEPSRNVAGYAPRRIVPPKSALPDTAACCSAIVAITGADVSGSNSVEVAPSIPALRAASNTVHCRPKHSPNNGSLFSRAYVIAAILPSIPRPPNPPGTTMASSALNCPAASVS